MSEVLHSGTGADMFGDELKSFVACLIFNRICQKDGRIIGKHAVEERPYSLKKGRAAH